MNKWTDENILVEKYTVGSEAHPISNLFLHERQRHVVHNFKHRTVVVEVELLPPISKSSLHEKNK